MRWIGRRQSTNVEDSRGTGGGKILGGGIGAVVIAVIVYLLGGDPSQMLNESPTMPQTAEQKAADDSAANFVKVVFADTEDVWNKIFREKYGRDYEEPTLHLFSGSIASACGQASSATGPFYCPLDEKVYIDGSFYSELHNRFGAPGDFAMAYVVAHEVGHHVQHLLGISDKVHQLQQNSSEQTANSYSVQLELQADFLAGVWAHYEQSMKDVLDPGDIDEALAAANAVGDDRLQEQAQGYVVPESFTHGTSQQRMYWFKKGFETGDIDQGNTFGDELP